MLNLIRSRAAARRQGQGVAAAAFVAVLAGWSVPALAGAATAPQSATTCWGSLKHDPSGKSSGEPNLLDYHFDCNGDISTYTVIVNRRPGRSGNIDDFDPGPLVQQPDGTPSSTQSFKCAATLPGSGINCNAPAAGGVMSAWNTAVSSFDPVDPYCGKPAISSKPAEPRAIVQLVVTDTTGAEDGPFTLNLKPGCPKPRKHTRRH